MSKDETQAGSELSEKLGALQGMADAAYCRYIDQMRQDNCLGWEIKVNRGEFTKDNLDAFMRAAENLGRHRGITEAIKVLSA